MNKARFNRAGYFDRLRSRFSGLRRRVRLTTRFQVKQAKKNAQALYEESIVTTLTYWYRAQIISALPWSAISKQRWAIFIGSWMILAASFSVLASERLQWLADQAQLTELAQQVVAPQRLPAPSHLFIPWKVDADITSQRLLNGRWVIAENGVSYLEDSGRPGEETPVVLYGHNTREQLGNIRAMVGGEPITLTTEDGAVHRYDVETIQEVDPANTSILKEVSGDRLIMYTCSGFWDSRRWVVVAKRQVSVALTQATL